MLVVADTAAPFLPAPLADLLVYAADADARAVFEAALDMIPRVFGATKVRPACLCVWSDDGRFNINSIAFPIPTHTPAIWVGNRPYIF